MTKEEINLIDKYFRASNYLSACQLYLLDNPLLKRPLKIEDIKRNITRILSNHRLNKTFLFFLSKDFL